MSLLMVICGVTLDIYNLSLKSFRNLEKCIEERANSRIAMDFVASHLREAKVVSAGYNSVSLDGHVIYNKNNILRYDYDSEQIANNIDCFTMEVINNNLFRIVINSGEYTSSTIISRRR